MLDLGHHRFGPRGSAVAARQRLEALRFDLFEAVPLGACLGAEIRGVDLSQPVPAALGSELERALVEYKVLFFRDQHIDTAQQSRFAATFGELEVHPFLPANQDHPEVIRFAKDAETVGVENVWHSDVSWRQIPSLGSMLRAISVPATGGDTIWCDMEAAYEGLDDDFKARIADLRAVHDFTQSFGQLLSPAERAEHQEKFPPASHPVVRTHPVSGRKCIYVNRIFTSHVDGVTADESRELLRTLTVQAEIPEYQVRFRWAPGSVAFWDNRSTQHYALSDYFPLQRIMERVTVIGDRPF